MPGGRAKTTIALAADESDASLPRRDRDPRVERCGLAFPDEPGLTSFTNPAIRYSVPEKPYVVLRRGEVEAVVVDNRAVDDDVLPRHRAGYSGLAALRHARRRENLFVPAFAGLNFEHIHDGTTQPREILFEPRNAPMELRRIDDHIAELYQRPTPHWGLESCLRYELLPDGADRDDPGVHPASAELPERLHRPVLGELHRRTPSRAPIHFRGHPEGSDASPRWIEAVSPEHGIRATHLAPDDRREFPHDEAFPLTLVFNRSTDRYDEPWYFGVSHGMAYVQLFRRDRVRIAQSPSGGGEANPAWDFQAFIPN